MFKYRNKFHEKMTLHPIMTLLILCGITILISGILSFIGAQVTYNKIDPNLYEYSPTTVQVNSLLSLSGLKYIFTNTVLNFVSFTPLSSLIIILIGFGIMEKSGFLKTAITLLTKKAKKKNVTFVLVLSCILLSLVGDLPYVVMIPLAGVLFMYGKRNPAIGIIASFAALTCGSGLSLFLTSIDSAVLSQTKLGAMMLDQNYNITTFAFIFIMTVAIFAIAIAITKITEDYTAKKLAKYDFDLNSDEEEEEYKIGKQEKRGLIIALIAGFIYLLIFVYNIIPGLPFSGNLLDYSQSFYIDKLFSYNSFFSNGFVFIVTMLFVILGFFYGIGAKTIKNNKDFSDALGHSLDGTGKILVLIFFAATFVSIFKQTNIGTYIVASFANFISNGHFSGFMLIFIIFIISILSTIVMPSSITKWAILGGAIVPLCMNAGISPEFSQIIYRFGECATLGLTPLFAYYVIYLAYLEKYNQKSRPVSLFTTLKYQLPYSVVTAIVLIVIILVWYVIGLPIGIGGHPVI
ncbi:MAG: AbgT family transporter [Bacilli bacterium]|nr:AbgT family transporter [Bacilli bacterium]